MSVPEFFFALHLSDNAPHDQMLGEVAKALCAYAGVSPAAIGDVTASLKAAIGDGGRACDVRFTGHAGQFDISVSHDGGKEWRTSRALP